MQNRLIFDNMPPLWALLLLGAFGVLIVLVSALGTRRVRSLRLRVLMVLLRLIGVLGVALALLAPGIERTRSIRIENLVAVLIDTSRSMTLPFDASGQPRAELVRAYADRHSDRFEELEEQFDVRWFSFADELQSAGPGLAAEFRPEGPRTDFLHALRQLQRRVEGKPLRAVLLLSDGADTETLDAGTPEQAGEALRHAARALGAPVHSFITGSGGAVKDVAVSEVKASAVAFTRRAWPLSVVIEAAGYPPGTRLPVVLRIGGELIATRTLKVQKGIDRYTVEFTWTPPRVGRIGCLVTVPPRPDEIIKSNNYWAFTADVVRDKIRVLHVAGAPSWDVRFLRRTLKRDPSVDLVSFFILRTRTDPVAPATPGKEVNLIPFPVNELFTAALSSFDVIVFQNFDYRPYEIPGYMTFSLYLRNIREQVVNGAGGFVMIGGDQSFGRGGYRGTPLQDVLPVLVGGTAEPTNTLNFRAVPTDTALRHPITAIGASAEETKRLWMRMPELHGSHVIPAKEGAVTLLVREDLQSGGERVPIVSVSDAGKGRAMAVMTDQSWRWNFVAAGQGTGNIVYLRFWRNAIRWLVHDPIGQRLKIDVDKTSYLPNENVVAQLQAFTPYYTPQAGTEYRIGLFAFGENKEHAERTLRTDTEGRIVTTFSDLPRGAYLLRATPAQPPPAGTEAETAETSFNVAEQSVEFRRIRMGVELMRELAEATGGRFVALGGQDAAPFPTEIPNPVVEQPIEREFQPIWSTWAWFAVTVLALVGEWWLRRWYGVS